MKTTSYIALIVAAVLAVSSPHGAWAQAKKTGGAGENAGGKTGANGAGADDDSKDPLYKCNKTPKQVTASFPKEVELSDLVTWAMGFTCRNFIYNASVGGRKQKVRLITPRVLSPREAWRMFLVSLHSIGLTVVPKGRSLRIVETTQVKKESLPLYARQAPALQQLVRLIVRPKHIPVQDLATALNAMTSKDGQVTSLTASGIILITDYGNQISRMQKLTREIDQPIVGERLYMLRIRNADVSEVSQKLEQILGTKGTSARGGSTPTRNSRRTNRRGKRNASSNNVVSSSAKEVEAAVPSKIMADERTSSLIILGSKPAYLRVRALVQRLDVPVDVEGAGRIHVYNLENADAQEMATTLTTVISGVSSPTPNRNARTNRNTRSTARNTRNNRTAAASDSAPAFEGQVRVTHDAPTNSLVIVASVKDFLALRDVIKRLDTPRRQVFIEAVIMEVTADDRNTVGVSFHGGKDLDILDGDAVVLGGLQQGDLQSLNPASVATATGLVGGIIGPLLDNTDELLGLGTSVPSVGLLFQALATNSNVNVLSSPHIVTTDNEEAEISVGQNIPFQSTLPGVAAGQIPVAPSIQRQDVALTLKIKPYINASDVVRLEIDQEISDIASEDFGGNGPSWSKRTLKTQVVVRDQQTIVIGGLIQDRESVVESKIPLLGDIPLLGYLFKSRTKRTQKVNLLVMLTPYVVRDHVDIEEIRERKVRERTEFVSTYSTFAALGAQRDIDYRRKAGLVEAINRSVETVESEEKTLKMMRKDIKEYPDGPIEYIDPLEAETTGTGPESLKDDKAKAATPGADKASTSSGDNKAPKTGSGKTGKSATAGDKTTTKRSE